MLRPRCSSRRSYRQICWFKVFVKRPAGTLLPVQWWTLPHTLSFSQDSFSLLLFLCLTVCSFSYSNPKHPFTDTRTLFCFRSHGMNTTSCREHVIPFHYNPNSPFHFQKCLYSNFQSRLRLLSKITEFYCYDDHKIRSGIKPIKISPPSKVFQHNEIHSMWFERQIVVSVFLSGQKDIRVCYIFNYEFKVLKWKFIFYANVQFLKIYHIQILVGFAYYLVYSGGSTEEKEGERSKERVRWSHLINLITSSGQISLPFVHPRA